MGPATNDAAYSSTILSQTVEHFERNGLKPIGSVLLWCILVLLRWMVGLHSYSGQGNAPMFGDYEAQRHWMEITRRLPLSHWYFNTSENDLMYWGLDYPPLTAYVSYAFGFVADHVEPNLVALTTSRGYESPTSKVFMRATVIFCDILIFIPAVFIFARTIIPSSWTHRAVLSFVILSQPALLLIDHGHFQYNNVSLGLTVLAVVLILRDHEFLGSIAYSLALNFKQMTLYYAPAFGIYLLARCIHRPHPVFQIFKLAIAVVTTFLLLWYPFCLYSGPNEDCLSSVSQVVHRIFPFARGLFEDKVANFWCVFDLVFKIRQRVPAQLQMRLCTLSTLAAFTPSVIDLLRRKPTKQRFLLALVNASLAFFLFSFQVHEKTIILPLLPVVMLYGCFPLISSWFGFVSTFSMFFLLKKDGLALPYLALQAAYFMLVFFPSRCYPSSQPKSELPPGYSEGKPCRLLQGLAIISATGTCACHLLHLFLEAPQRYPHIHDYLFAAYSFGHFAAMLVYCTIWQWRLDSKNPGAKLKSL